MAYIGNTQLNQNYVPAVDFFSGNGSTTAFTLSRPVASVAAIQAVISNVPQDPGTAFTVSGSTITFTSAPPSGTNNIYVYYTSPNTQVVQPGQGTVYPASLSTGGPYWNTSGNVGIGTSSPVNPLVVSNAGAAGIEINSTSINSYNRSGAAWAPITYNASYQVFSYGGTSEAMRIDSSGNVGIGTTTSLSRLTALGSSSTVANGASTRNPIASIRGGNDNNRLDVYVDNSGATAIMGLGAYNTAGGATAMAFYTGASVDERMRIDSSGNLLFNSGYGSVATAYGCRAWVNFNGTGTVAIRASGNVSSITDNGTGAYVVNLTNAMPDTNYAPISCGNNTAGSAAQNSMYNSTPVTTSTFTVNIVTNGGGPRDDAVVTSAVFR